MVSLHRERFVVVHLSNVSAMSDSDVGGQYMFITFLTDFQYVIDLKTVKKSFKYCSKNKNDIEVSALIYVTK